MRDDERLNLLSSTCSGVAVSSDHKYHTPAVLQVLVTKTEKVSKAMFARLRPDRSNQGGKLTLQQVPHEITNRVFKPVFAATLSALLAMLFCLLTVKVWFELQH